MAREDALNSLYATVTRWDAAVQIAHENAAGALDRAEAHLNELVNTGAAATAHPDSDASALARERQRVVELQRLLAEVMREREEAPEEGRPLEPRGASLLEKVEDFSVPTLPAFEAHGHRKRVGEILVAEGVLSQIELHDLLAEQGRTPHVRLGTLAVARGFTNESLVAKILAAQLRLPFVNLDNMELDRAMAALLSPHLARLHKCVPLRRTEDRLTIAMTNPLDLIAIEDIELAGKCMVEPVVATPSGIRAALEMLYGSSA